MEYGIPCGCLVKVSEDTLTAEIDYCEMHSGNISFPCGCTVVLKEAPVPEHEELKVRTQTLKHCPKHQTLELSLPAEHLVAFTEAADKLMTEASKNMDGVAEAGRKLVDAMKHIKNPGD